MNEEEWIPIKVINGETFVGKKVNGTIIWKREQPFKVKWFKGGKK